MSTAKPGVDTRDLQGLVSGSASSAAWRYDSRGWTRDLRIDFLRGFVFVLLFSTHFHLFSWVSLLGWERLGVFSSAEVFILLAGIVTGSVYGKKLMSDGLAECTLKLGRRAWTLYKIAVIVSGSVALLRLILWIDTTVLTTFVDPTTGIAYPLFPPVSAGFLSNLFHVMVLAATPHQFQIVGLYAVLFLLTPIIFWAISRGYTPWLLLASWIAYFVNYYAPEQIAAVAAIRLTLGQFEYGFPTIAWQLIFVHGVVIGFYRQRLFQFFTTGAGYVVYAIAALSTLMFLLFTLNHPLDMMPDWATLDWIAPDTFNSLYQAFFLKYKLGPGRLINLAAFMITALGLLTIAWKPINRALGWLFVPLGQESMYVFFVHVYLILIIFNSGLPALNDVWVNTAIHLGALLLCWFMVKTRFLFNWVPR